VRVESLNLKGRPKFSHVAELARIIDHQQPDIVHAVMYQAIQLARLAKRRCKAKFKLVSSPRVSYRTRSTWTLFVDRALKGADDLLIAECESSRQYLIKRLGYAPQKVRTIYNGVDVARWPVSRMDRSQRRLELRLGASDVLVGCVGRLDGQKGHNTLIEAMSKLKGRHPARLAILGDGPRRSALEAQIRKLSLEKSVWLLGERDDVVSWLSAFDLFALPSYWEGLPNALLEAMALGLPPVASAVDGVPEVIEDGKSGLLVAPKDSMALAKAVATLAGDPGLRSRLGAQAQQTIAERFGLLTMIEAYQAAYESVLGG
jgi:glycosyltransferase involved in cell wall biosynthesis